MCPLHARALAALICNGSHLLKTAARVLLRTCFEKADFRSPLPLGEGQGEGEVR